MKAILVIDVPDNILLDFSKANIEIKENAYLVNKDENEWKYTKPIKIEGVSLKPLPSKLVPFGYLDAGNEDGLYEKGYNDCIDDITGEPNESRMDEQR